MDRFSRLRFGVVWPLYLLALFGTTGTVGAEPPTGEQIYTKQCAACHGTDGQGTKDHPDPLAGDRPLAGLVKFIEKEMPEETPEACAGADAERVAKYIFDAFYSPIAQARHRPARIELSRLTVRQYENSVADLLSSFGPPSRYDAERGITVEYSNSRYGFSEKNRVATRREVSIQYSGPDAELEKLLKDEYVVRWRGGLFAPVTGQYDITLIAKNGAMVWINEERVARIDAWVRSGAETKQTISLRLLSGRVYPIRVDMRKSKNDAAAALELRWKPPHGVDELIPRRNLSPHQQPEVLVLDTHFPPDDRSRGYERGTLVSKEWDRATTDAALEVAAHVERNLNKLAHTDDASTEREKKIRQFCEKFAERAFGEPLTDEQRKIIIDRQFQAAADPVTAAKRVVLLALKSPRFLYHGLNGEKTTDYERASRISYGLWDSLPDQELLTAAAQGNLNTREQVEAQVRRMLADARTRSKVRDFFHRWLQLERTHGVAKDREPFPSSMIRLWRIFACLSTCFSTT